MTRFLLFALCIGIFGMPQPAMAENIVSQILRKVFNEPVGPQPEDTLKAPFPTDKTTQAPQNNLMTIYDTRKGQTGVLTSPDQAHMTTHALQEWVSQAVTNSLTLDKAQLDPQKLSMSFEPYAVQEFQNWLQTSGVITDLQNRDVTLRAVAAAPPQLLSQGVLSGTYRWVFEVPVLVSYVPRGTTSLKTAAAIPQSRNFTLRVQIGRVNAQNDTRVLIERWASAS